VREVALPLVRPFRTSFGEERGQRASLVRVDAGDVSGWGECAASPEPRYSEEWNDGVWLALTAFLLPCVLDGGPVERHEDVGARMAWVRGQRMAKAAVEAAVLDAWLRMRERALASHVGAVRRRVPCGVSVGIAPDVDAMLEEIGGDPGRGYRRGE